MNTTSERSIPQGGIPQGDTEAPRDISTAPSMVDEHSTATNEPSGHEQLTLLSVPVDTRATRLPSSAVHPRFQLNRETREIGLAHVAEIRRQLAEAQAVRESANVQRLPRRRTTAA